MTKDKLGIIINWATLIIISILCFIIWRYEINYHGWDGLTWLYYFHWAIPSGFVIFLVWCNFQVKINLLKRTILNVLAIGYGLILYHYLKLSLVYTFAGGPEGFLITVQTPEWKFFYIENYFM